MDISICYFLQTAEIEVWSAKMFVGLDPTGYIEILCRNVECPRDYDV